MQRAFFICVLLCTSLSKISQANVKSTGTPQIKNYTQTSIPAGSQSWMITYDQYGMVYFANNDGVLSFDGISWQLFTLPNRTLVRSVLATNDTLYAGGYNEFGYFTKMKNGKFEFTSLHNLLPPDYQDFGEIWKIYNIDSQLIFQSFERIMILHDQKFKTIEAPNNFHFSYYVNDRFIINDQIDGLFELFDEKLEPLKGTELLAGKLIWSIIPHDNGMLIATADDGLFYYENEQLIYWDTEASALLREKQIYCGIKIDDQNIAFGTIQDGLIICNNEGHIKQHLNIDRGLQNNTVLSLSKDMFGNLWLGLDNGIDYLEINSPLSYFSYPSNLSAGYTAVLFEDNLYLGTNRGVFYHNWESLKNSNTGQQFKLVKNTQGQVWDLKVIDNTLFCGHNSGIFTIKDSTAKLLSDVQGAWSFIQPNNEREVIISGTYTNLIKLGKKSKVWEQKAIVEGFKESSRFLSNAENGSIWMSHGYKGVFNITLNTAYDSVISVQFYDSNKGFPTDKNIVVVDIFGQSVFCTGNGYYIFNESSNSFIPHEYLNKLISRSDASKLVQDSWKNIWYFTDDETGVFRYQEDGSYLDVSLPFRELSGRTIRSFQFVLPLDEKNVFIGMQEGFAHYTPDFTKNYNKSYPALIRTVAIASNDSVIFWGNENLDANNFVLPYVSNQLNFSFSALDYENPDKLQFSTFLEGFDQDWTAWDKTSMRQFTNLKHGTYTFKVKAKNLFNTESSTVQFAFEILPPWYYSWWAYAFYIFIAIGMIYSGVKYLKYRVIKSKLLYAQMQQKKFQEREKQLQTETLEAEKEVIRLRNEKLREAMLQKDKELANNTMQMIQKSKTLTYLKRDLQKLAKESKDEMLITKIRIMIKKINRDIDTDKQWEVFESHFESVHEEFLKRLKQQYPDLSPRELKLCAYLRLNISSKEIASLMNISVRGVEISRYRLRKKLKLEHDQNLTDFIMMY